MICLLVAAFGAAGSGAARAASPFPVRGVVEGAYGRPWTAPERERVLRFMDAHGLNTYVHAPKDDLYQRTHWRDPYPAAQQRDFTREIALARRLGIRWIANLSPALPLIPTVAVPDGSPSRDLCFSCPADLAALVAKFAPFVAAGADAVAVSFDDVTKVFTHPEDMAAYGGGDEAFGRACGEVLTKLRAAFVARGTPVDVLTVGADYSGTSDTPFLRGFRATLHPAIDAMWTGNEVPATDFSGEDARAYGRAVGRAPIVWDNWTNTDTAGSIFGPDMTVRIFLGPYRHQPDLAGAVKGFLLNPANEAVLNLLPLATAADYLAAPRSYEPRASFLRAVAEMAGARRDLREPLRAFAETMWSNKLDRARDAPTFVARRDAALAAYDGDGAWPDPLLALREELELVVAARSRLAGLPEPGLGAALSRYLASAQNAARAGLVGATLLAGTRPSVDVDAASGIATVRAPSAAAMAGTRVSLVAARTAFETDLRFAYGWRTPFAIEAPPYAAPQNAMSRFLDAVHDRDGRWLPRSAAAGASVRAEIDGRPVELGPGGRVAVRCGQRIVAIDGAGGRTTVVVRCAPPGTLRLVRRRLRGGRLRLEVRGPEIRRVTFRIAVRGDTRHVAHRTRAPFATTVRLRRSERRARRLLVRARVVQASGASELRRSLTRR